MTDQVPEMEILDPTRTAGGEDPGPDEPEQTALHGDGEYLDDDRLRSALEAVLLVVDTPVTTDELANAVDQDRTRVREMLNAMSSELTASGSGFDLRFAGDGWRYYTRAEYAPYVERLLLDGARSKLTRAALETLAVIAYRQPVTRARVSAIRGVNVDGVIRTLVARGLINEVGTEPTTNATTYATTELFLERLGLASLTELPDLAPLLPDVDLIDDLDEELLSDPRFAKLSSQPSDSKELIIDGGTTTDSQD
ncbi:SMC-Scp complex subunit ScpB [Gordonia terrae]